MAAAIVLVVQSYDGGTIRNPSDAVLTISSLAWGLVLHMALLNWSGSDLVYH